MTKYTIFDCDNVLANDSWRIPLIDWNAPDHFQRFHSYHLASAFDEPGNRHLLRGLHAENVVIFTAMSAHYRTLRRLWFNQRRIDYRKLFMRPEGSTASSVLVKEHMLFSMFEQFKIGPRNIQVAYDDRDDIIDMYRRHGVAAEKVCLHNANVYGPPVRDAV